MGGGPSQKLLDMGGKGVGWGADPGNSLRVSVASVCVFAAQEPKAECRGVEGPGVCACAEALLWSRRVAGRGSKAAVGVGLSPV